jgi:2-polyprenyl-3-methyl-5-hydroxy-6-metoxy-1,4-benzoquinol methylase
LTQVIDEAKLNAFMGQAVMDMSAAASVALSYVGEKLGLYRAMAGAGPLSAAGLARKAGLDERMTTEWLKNQAAGGYVAYDPASDTYELPPEQAMALADYDSPAFIGGAFNVIGAMWVAAIDKNEQIFQGKGLGWHEQSPILFLGTERFFRPGYRANLTSAWIPALDGVEARLQAGAKVADVGCGHGASTVVMAQAYPNSTFVGYDYHDKSIETARQRVKEAGVADRVTFEVARAQDFKGTGFDLICFFDCLHDMGDPVGAAKHALNALKPDGTVLLVEPQAADVTEGNFNPVGRMFYAASTLICTPNGLSQAPKHALGAQAGEKRLGDVFREAGFTRFRRATETPFNLVLEAKP